MCNAIIHPAERVEKMIEGSSEMGKGRKFECEVLAQEIRKSWSL